MKFGLEVDIFEFDSKAFNVAVLDYLEKLMKEAAIRFAEVAISRIPVVTGFAAGAMGTLQDLLGVRAVLNPIVEGHSQYYYPPGMGRVLKTSLTGRGFGTPSSQIFVREGTSITFNYAIDITYFNINENSASRSPTAPWEAFSSGEAAFMKYMEDNLGKDVPQAADYMKTTTKKI